MNILFLTDGFTRGGLETHIIQLCRILVDSGHTPFLACGSKTNESLNRFFSKTLPSLSLSFDTKVRSFIETLSFIEKFIDENKIDVIHAHPFYSLFVGAVAANRKRIPLLCTIHGPYSVMGAPGPNPKDLWTDIISNSSVIAVSGELGAEFYKNYRHWPDIQPNIVDLNDVFLEPKKRVMLWCGRMDADKIPGLFGLLDLIDVLPNWRLDIAGAGTEQESVANRIMSSSSLHDRVSLLGWIDDTSCLMREYEIIAGMGRVVVEASALAIPCLLVGYDSVKGFVTPNMANAAAFTNFSGRLTKTENISSIASTLDAGLYRANGPEMKLWIAKNRSKEIIGGRYLLSLAHTKSFRSQKITNFYKKILLTSNRDASIWYDESFQIRNDFC